MKVAHVYVEYNAMSLNQSYLYLCRDFLVCKGIRVEVDFANRKVVGFVVKVEEWSEEKINSYSYSLKSILSVIDEKPLLNEELFALARDMSDHCVAPLISCFQTMLPAKLKPKSGTQKIKMEKWVRFVEEKKCKNTKTQALLSRIKEEKEIRYTSSSSLQTLLRMGCIECFEKEASKTLLKPQDDVRYELTVEQQNAIKQMNSGVFHTYLLHGVTGSGKTEVFLQMAEKVLNENKQVLILVPEISLTPQMVKRVNARFDNRVAIYHSSLNNQEKYEQYRFVQEGKVDIVVGTRSAIFMPFQKLGLIIMDEEHDQSYKQNVTPKYHTRDIALFRSKYHDCKLILASATPSLESYARAIKNVYTLVELPNRIYKDMPEIRFVNMQDAISHGESYILSKTLKNAIQERLEKKQQVILLLNRRGYAPILRCVDCGEVIMCPHCDLALNYHQDSKELKCHVCGYSEKVSYSCKKCGSKNIRYMGMGTQKLEEYLHSQFKEATIIRMDADTTQRKNAHEKLLSQFEKEGDILLGTQMISKGLDFERVTLVGILNADAMLNRSDYRSAELTFDLLVQASGRSGRGKTSGEVIMQVYDENQYALKCAKNHDYKTFFAQEMKYRHMGMYPPYSYIGMITFLHKQEDIVIDEANVIRQHIQKDNMKVLGPATLLKIKDQYRSRIVIKGKEQEEVSSLLHELLKKHQELKQKSKIELEMNPYTMD